MTSGFGLFPNHIITVDCCSCSRIAAVSCSIVSYTNLSSRIALRRNCLHTQLHTLIRIVLDSRRSYLRFQLFGLRKV